VSKKITKVVALLEQLRQDSPDLRDRVDELAEAMSQPADPQSVIDAIKETRVYAQLLMALGVSVNERATLLELEIKAIRLLKDSVVRVLVFDEVHNLLAGSPREQRVILQLFRPARTERDRLRLRVERGGQRFVLRPAQRERALVQRHNWNRYVFWARCPRHPDPGDRRVLSSWNARLNLTNRSVRPAAWIQARARGRPRHRRHCCGADPSGRQRRRDDARSPGALNSSRRLPLCATRGRTRIAG
jgi:hypothetical protein